MELIKGVIEAAAQRELNGKFGPYIAHSMLINDQWYGGLFKKPGENPGFAKGTTVEFVADQNAKGFWDIQKGTLKITAGGVSDAGREAPATAPTATVAAANQVGVKRELMIHYQSSRHDAVEVIKSMLAHDCITLPKSKEKRYDAVLALVDEVTAHLYHKLKEVEEDGVPTDDVELDDSPADLPDDIAA